VAGDTNGAKDIFVRDRTAKLTSRVSVNSAGVQANNESKAPSISADGRFVAFASNANNLVAGDTNGAWDIFIRDRSTNQTNRLSINNIGVQGNGESRNPTISADGRFVAFESFATNLVPSDTNGSWDFFVRDRLTNQTSRISVSSAGAQVTIGTFYGESTPAISADGRYIAFQSDAKNLVTNDTNLFSDIFLRDSLLNSSANADLKLTQSVSANLVSVGATFSYTATVSNQGPNNAANVVLSDFAPLNGTVGLPSLTPSQGTCYRGTTSICRLGTINAGQQASVQMSFTATRRGTAANRVTVNASPKDPTPFNAVTTNATIIP